MRPEAPVGAEVLIGCFVAPAPGSQAEFDLTGDQVGDLLVPASADGLTWARRTFPTPGTHTLRCRLEGQPEWSEPKTLAVAAAGDAGSADVEAVPGAAQTSFTVDADGGVFDLFDAGTLAFPEGAVGAPVRVQATMLDGLRPNARGATLVSGVRLEPEGTSFEISPILTLAVAPDAGARLLGFTAPQDGGAMAMRPVETDGGFASMALEHFSENGFMSPQCASLTNGPPEPLTTIDALTKAVLRYLCLSDAQGTPPYDEDIAAIIQEYVVTTLDPLFEEARTIDVSLNLVRTYVRSVAVLIDLTVTSDPTSQRGSPSLTLRNSLVSRVVSAFQAAAARYNAECRQTRKYADALYRTIRLARWAKQDAIFLDTAANRLDPASLGAAFCAKPRIMTAALPPLTPADTEGDTSSGKLTVAVDVLIDGTPAVDTVSDISVWFTDTAWTTRQKTVSATGATAQLPFTPLPGARSVSAEISACLQGGFPPFPCDERTVTGDVLGLVVKATLVGTAASSAGLGFCAPAGSTVALDLTLYKGNSGIGGVTLPIQLTSSRATLAPSSVTTDSSGRAQATLTTTAGTGFGSGRLQAEYTDPTSNLRTWADIFFQVGEPLRLNPPTLDLLYTFEQVRITAMTCVPGSPPVSFSATGGATVSQLDATRAVLTAPGTAGSFSLTAAVSGTSISQTVAVGVVEWTGVYSGTCQRYFRSVPVGVRTNCDVEITRLTPNANAWYSTIYPWGMSAGCQWPNDSIRENTPGYCLQYTGPSPEVGWGACGPLFDGGVGRCDFQASIQSAGDGGLRLYARGGNRDIDFCDLSECATIADVVKSP